MKFSIKDFFIFCAVLCEIFVSLVKLAEKSHNGHANPWKCHVCKSLAYTYKFYTVVKYVTDCLK